MDRRQFLRNALFSFAGAMIPVSVIDRFLGDTENAHAGQSTVDDAGAPAAENRWENIVGMDVAVHGSDHTAIMTFVKVDGRIYIKDHKFIPAQGKPYTITYKERKANE